MFSFIRKTIVLRAAVELIAQPALEQWLADHNPDLHRQYVDQSVARMQHRIDAFRARNDMAAQVAAMRPPTKKAPTDDKARPRTAQDWQAFFDGLLSESAAAASAARKKSGEARSPDDRSS